MTRNWITLAARTLRMAHSGTPSARRPRPAGVSLESLEARLALSSYSAGSFEPAFHSQQLPPIKQVEVTPQDLNPQPLPPGFMATSRSNTPTPQSVPVGKKQIVVSLDLNPQPLPPGFMAIAHPADAPLNPQPIPPGRHNVI